MINGGIQYTGFAIPAMRQQPVEVEQAVTPLASEVAGGTWGYSGPNNRQVIFCADAGREFQLRHWLNSVGLWFMEGEGVYNNEEPELCFIMNLDDFEKRVGGIRVFIENQESVLRLDHLVSQNWRDAHLVYINGREGTPYQPMYPDIKTVTPENQPVLCEHLGTFLEVTEQVAKLATGYSKFNGKYFAVLNNPPDCEEERKERANTQLLADAYLELAARNRKHRDTHGEWRKSTIAVTSRLVVALKGKVLENGNTVDDKWFQDELRTIREKALH